ncbi:MAG: hypothetical protein NTW50_02940 [Candidatus Berkelbacteria bacterium]|nr:hypothetical protein [Candidatus Berkelbacteria bacterium]
MSKTREKIEQLISFVSRYKWAVIFIIFGILVRLLLMPIAVHDDMLSSTWRDYAYIFRGNLKIDDLLDLAMAGYLKLFRPLFSELPSMLDRARANLATGTVAYDTFVNSRVALRYLFFLKIPYLIFDLASLAVIWKILEDRQQKLRGVIFWALNPALLFATFMWGRFETLPIFLTLLAFLFAYKKNPQASIAVLSLAISARTGYVLFLPFFLIYFARDWKQILTYSIIGLLPMFVTSHLFGIFGGGGLLDTLQGGFFDFTISGQISTGFTSIAINALTFPLILFLFWTKKENMTFKRLVSFSTIGVLSFFAFSFFHPQYLAWVTPALVLAFALNKKIIWPIIILMISYFFMIDMYFGFGRTTGLFAPLNYSFFSTLGGLANQSFFANWSGTTLLTIFHSIFVLMIAVISFILYQDENKTK